MLCPLTNFCLMVFSPPVDTAGGMLILQMIFCPRLPQVAFLLLATAGGVLLLATAGGVLLLCRQSPFVPCLWLSGSLSGCLQVSSWFQPDISAVGAAVTRCPLFFSFLRWHVPWNWFSCSAASPSFSQSYQPYLRWNILACFCIKSEFSLNFFILLTNRLIWSYAIFPNLPCSAKNWKILLVAKNLFSFVWVSFSFLFSQLSLFLVSFCPPPLFSSSFFLWNPLSFCPSFNW